MCQECDRVEIHELRQQVPLPSTSQVRPLVNLGRSDFGFDLSRALYEARQAGRVPEQTDAEIRERMIWLRIRHESLGVFGRRIEEEVPPVFAKALAAAPDEAGYGLFVGRTSAVTLTADLEALIILLRATLDGIVRLAHAVERDVLHEPETPVDQLRSLPGVDAAERQLLRQARNGFAHGQAAWPEVLQRPGQSPDLLIAARIQPDHGKGEGYILLSQIERWWKALEEQLFALEASLAARVRALIPQ